MKTLSTIAALVAATATQGVNILRISGTGTEGETVTIGPDVFELTFDGIVGAGRKPVDISAGSGAVAATGVFTGSINFTPADEVTIGDVTFTLVESASNPGEVEIGADLEATLAALAAAINGTDGTHLPHELVTATSDATTLTVTAKTTGTVGNGIDTLYVPDDAPAGSWAAAATASGANATINAAGLRAALVAAIGGDRWGAEAVGDYIVIFSELNRDSELEVGETLAGTNNAWSADAFYGGSGEALRIPVQVDRVVTAAEVSAGLIPFAFAHQVSSAVVQARTAAGANKAFSGTVTLDGQAVVIANTGGTALVAGDTVIVSAVLDIPSPI